MNSKNLQSIFKKYIDNFEMLNSANKEIYKWEIAQKFQSFDLDTKDFANMLSRMWKASENLIDSSQQLPFYALVEYARKESETETVREMFRKLYAEEHLDNNEKQRLINEFIDSSEELRMKYFPNSHLYINNQRSVMMYLFLRYPNSNYGYKASQAKSFANCVEFYEDWGPMTDFRIDTFSRMCDQLIAEIKENDALIKTHKRRFENTKHKLHPDENLHILAFDIIYSSQAYNFYSDISFKPINAQARRLYFERVAKAKELAEVLKKCKEDSELLAQAEEYIAGTLVKGIAVKHKTYGEGTIEKCSTTKLVVYFPGLNETKKFGLTTVIENNILEFPSEEISKRIKSYIPVLKNESRIATNLSNAEKAIQPYWEYLD